MHDHRFPNADYLLSWHTVLNKTIKSVDTKTAANQVILRFSDGTSVAIESEPIGHGLYTPVLIRGE
jgi:hypothetical protein